MDAYELPPRCCIRVLGGSRLAGEEMSFRDLFLSGERLVATLHAGPYLLHADADTDALQAALEAVRPEMEQDDPVVVSRNDLKHALGTCGCNTHVDHRDHHLPAVTRLRKVVA